MCLASRHHDRNSNHLSAQPAKNLSRLGQELTRPVVYRPATADNGSISFQPLERVLHEMLTNDPGKQGSMPLLADFVARDVPVPAV
eukprot:769955-Pleurochrysis_carterae.AAC.1